MHPLKCAEVFECFKKSDSYGIAAKALLFDYLKDIDRSLKVLSILYKHNRWIVQIVNVAAENISSNKLTEIKVSKLWVAVERQS